MNGTLLVAEDHESARELISYALEGEGYNLIFAENGAEAARVVSQRPFDAALLDVCLPGVPGGDVCRQIKARRQATPVILMSGALGAQELAQETDAAGADAFLPKPFSLDELRTILRAFTRVREQAAEIERLRSTLARAESELTARSTKQNLDWALPYHDFMKLARKSYFEHALEAANGNKSKLSRKCGLDRSTLYVHLRNLGMLPEKKQP